MEPPPNLNRPALHNPLPTPPQQIHDNFHDKESAEIKSKEIGQQNKTNPTQSQEKEYTPPQTIFRKRSHDEAFDANDEGAFGTDLPKTTRFEQDFDLYPSQSDGANPEKAADEAGEETNAVTKGTNQEAVGSSSEHTTGDVLMDDASERAHRKEAEYRAWEARHPVVTPAEQYNRNRMVYAHFLAKERRETKELARLEIERRKEWNQASMRRSSKASPTTANKQKAVKRRRVEERDTTPPYPDHLHEREIVDLKVEISMAKEAANGTDLASPPVTPRTKPRKDVAKSNMVTPVKTSPKKKVTKTNKVVKRKPGKPCGINEHMDAIKATLNARPEKAGKAKQKNAPELFEDAFIPSISLEGKRLVEPSREIQPKPLDVNDPFYSQLHPTERTLAERVRATPSEYITQKRRYFLGLGEWWRLGHESVNPSHAQSFCNQDGNNTSYMHRVYDDWGWSKRSLWSDELLESIAPLTSCEPWVRK